MHGCRPADTGAFVTGSFDETVRVWDTNASAVATQFALPAKVYAVALPPPGAGHCLIAAATGAPTVSLCGERGGIKEGEKVTPHHGPARAGVEARGTRGALHRAGWPSPPPRVPRSMRGSYLTWPWRAYIPPSPTTPFILAL